MICETMIKKYCCDDFSLIEGYEEAISSTDMYDVHHRLETHTSDGERRLVNLSQKELIALDMYYDRPVDELVFISHSEHMSLHNKGMSSWSKGKHFSEEHKRKLSEANKGKPLSEEHRIKDAEVHRGKHPSEETRKKMAAVRKGKHWKTVDGHRVWY